MIKIIIIFIFIFIEIFLIAMTYFHLIKQYNYAVYCYDKQQLNKHKSNSKKVMALVENIVQENRTEYINTAEINNNILQYPNLIFYFNGRKIKTARFQDDKIFIGRDKSDDIVIDELSISRKQCYISKENNKYFINNNVKSNPVLVNNSKIKNEKEELCNGDIISMGNGRVSFQFVLP